MIEINVNEDIRQFEPSIIGPFTLKQIPFVVTAIILAYVAKWVSQTVFEGSDEAMAALILLFAGPPLFLGFGKKNGIPMTRYLRYVFQSEFLFPKFRKYKIENPVSRLKKYENETEKIKKTTDKNEKTKTIKPVKPKKTKLSKARRAEIEKDPLLRAFK